MKAAYERRGGGVGGCFVKGLRLGGGGCVRRCLMEGFRERRGGVEGP